VQQHGKRAYELCLDGAVRGDSGDFSAFDMSKIRLLVLFSTILAGGIAPLHADAIFEFNESGNLGFILNGGQYVTLPEGIVEPDPTGGFTGGDVLVYNLTSELDGFVMFNGDVPIGLSDGLIGDLRFTDPAGVTTGSETCGTTQCLMIFYVFDSNGLPADIDPSTAFLQTQTPGTVLNDGQFSYTAGVVDYQGDIVPEPAPAAMLLSGLAAFALLRKGTKATIR
jgi:hypothetical protein